MDDKEANPPTNQPDMSPVLDSASLGPYSSARLDGVLPAPGLSSGAEQQAACLIRGFSVGVPDYTFFTNALPNQPSDGTQFTSLSLPGQLVTLASKGSSNSSVSITPEMQSQLWGTFAQMAQASNPTHNALVEVRPASASVDVEGSQPAGTISQAHAAPPVTATIYPQAAPEQSVAEAVPKIQGHKSQPPRHEPHVLATASEAPRTAMDNLLLASESAMSDLSHVPVKEQLPVKEQQHSKGSFAAYEKKYGVTLKCDAGACAVELANPCSTHKCTCCKMGRQVLQYSRQGWCGPCGRREVVSGLKFVRCGRCKAEMLEDTYTAHLKQNVSVTDEDGKKISGRCIGSPHEIVNTDKGRRCGKCTNMRPLTFYSNTDSNCTCNMHLPSKATIRTGVDAKVYERASKPPSGRQVARSYSHPGLAHIDASSQQAGEAGPSQGRSTHTVGAAHAPKTTPAFTAQAQELQACLQAALNSTLPVNHSLSSMISACQQLNALSSGAEPSHGSQAAADTSGAHPASGRVVTWDSARAWLDSGVEDLRNFTVLVSKALAAHEQLVATLASTAGELPRPKSPGPTHTALHEQQSPCRSHSVTTMTVDHVADVGMYRGPRLTTSAVLSVHSVREGSLGPTGSQHMRPYDPKLSHGGSGAGVRSGSIARTVSHDQPSGGHDTWADGPSTVMPHRQLQPAASSQRHHVKQEHSSASHQAGVPAYTWLAHQPLQAVEQQQPPGITSLEPASSTPAPSRAQDGDVDNAEPAIAALLALKSSVDVPHGQAPSRTEPAISELSSGPLYVGAAPGGDGASVEAVSNPIDTSAQLVRPMVHRLVQPSSQLQSLNIPVTPGATSAVGCIADAPGSSQGPEGEATGTAQPSATTGTEVVVGADHTPVAGFPGVGFTLQSGRSDVPGILDAATMWSLVMQHGGQVVAVPGPMAWPQAVLPGLAGGSQGQHNPLYQQLQFPLMTFPAAPAATASQPSEVGKRSRDDKGEEQGSEGPESKRPKE